jgi:addiction module HigA family antidote
VQAAKVISLKKHMSLTQVEAAQRMALPLTRLNEIVRGKRGVSADTAWSLSELLGTTPQFWMNLQVAWDLWHAREARERAGRTRKPIRRVSRSRQAAHS